MQGYQVDIESDIVQQQFAVVYAPRRKRDRFPENCVRVMTSEEDARAAQCAGKHLHAAIVVGPARSSEGFRMFYLVTWLEAE